MKPVFGGFETRIKFIKFGLWCFHSSFVWFAGSSVFCFSGSGSRVFLHVIFVPWIVKWIFAPMEMVGDCGQAWVRLLQMTHNFRRLLLFPLLYCIFPDLAPPFLCFSPVWMSPVLPFYLLVIYHLSWISVALLPPERKDLSYVAPSLTTGGALCLVMHLVSYRGRLKQNFSFSLVHWKREFNPWWVNKSCTMIPVFYSTGCEDWTAKEDSPQEGFTGLTTPHFA